MSPKCKPIANEIASLEQEKADFQAELQEAAPGQKPFIVSQIKALTKQINAKKSALALCIKQNPA